MTEPGKAQGVPTKGVALENMKNQDNGLWLKIRIHAPKTPGEVGTLDQRNLKGLCPKWVTLKIQAHPPKEVGRVSFQP